MVSSYPNGFANGLTVRGMPINIAYPGKVFFVNNSGVLPDGGLAGSDANPGTYLKPFSTIAGGLTQCTASRGDILMVMPGHTETVSSATGLLLNKAGVCIVGMGEGTLRPTITLNTANTATIAVSANNVSIVNCVFVANFLDIASCFTLTTAKGFTLENCETRDTSSVLNFKAVVDTDTTSNNADDLTLNNCKHYGLSATNATCIVKMDGTNTRLKISDCYLAHAATTQAGLMPIATGKVVTNAIIDRNIINLVGAQAATTGIIITTDGTTNSGMICRNLIKSLDDTSELLVTASSGFIYSQNYYAGVADKSGYLLPAADA